MALRPAYLLTNVEFDDFLFAPVGVENNGMPLTVISALTRLDFDPWEKAAQLSRLTAKDAILTLAALIARLPVGRWDLTDASTIAARLVALLPKRAAPGRRHEGISPPQETAKLPIAWLICLALLAAGLFGIVQSMSSPRRNGLPSDTASHVAAPASADK